MNIPEPEEKPASGAGFRGGSRRDAPPRRTRLGWLILGVGILLCAWVFREPLRDRIRQNATLSNDAPPPEVVADMIQQAADPVAALHAAWNLGGIVHRQVAIRSFSRVFPTGESLDRDAEALLISAALDPDLNVRETALGVLKERKHPARSALVIEQLRDADLQVRLLGLKHLKDLNVKEAIWATLPMLEDPDPLIVTMALKVLEKWSGENFGVRIKDTTSFLNPETGLKEYRAESEQMARAGAARAGEWWTRHRDGFPQVRVVMPPEAYQARRPVSAGDFELPTLDGRIVRLADFRGKVVLINFWTTWCTACVSEMPALISLQRQHQDQLVILGVSLDYVPDSHGHIGGHATVEEQTEDHGVHDDHETGATALRRVRAKVARTVKARGINYPILLDEDNEVGGRFNGGELPTTVIVDAEGFVRRRFVGARGLAVFEEMIREASVPLPAR